MNIEQKVNRAFAMVGREIHLEQDGQVHRYMAVVQPIHDKSKLYLESSYSSLGKLDRSHALYYGPVSGGGEHIREGSLLLAGTVSYTVKICEEFFYQEKSIYIWAVLQRAFDEEVTEYV